MSSIKLSSNYQVVIPKVVRKKLGLQKGQMLYIKSVGKKDFHITSESPADSYYGALKGVWREDAVKYQRRIRKELERSL